VESSLSRWERALLWALGAWFERLVRRERIAPLGGGITFTGVARGGFKALILIIN